MRLLGIASAGHEAECRPGSQPSVGGVTQRGIEWSDVDIVHEGTSQEAPFSASRHFQGVSQVVLRLCEIISGRNQKLQCFYA